MVDDDRANDEMAEQDDNQNTANEPTEGALDREGNPTSPTPGDDIIIK